MGGSVQIFLHFSPRPFRCGCRVVAQFKQHPQGQGGHLSSSMAFQGSTTGGRARAALSAPSPLGRAGRRGSPSFPPHCL